MADEFQIKQVGCGELANRITHPHPNLPPEGEGTIAPPLSRGRLGGGWVNLRERCGSFVTASYGCPELVEGEDRT